MTEKKKEFNIDEVIENATKILSALSIIVECGNVIVNNLKAYRENTLIVDSVEPPKQIESKETPAVTEKKYTKEDVRAVLAAKSSADGGKYRNEVKALVKKYADGGSLTDVREEDYSLLLKEVEGL